MRGSTFANVMGVGGVITGASFFLPRLVRFEVPDDVQERREIADRRWRLPKMVQEYQEYRSLVARTGSPLLSAQSDGARTLALKQASYLDQWMKLEDFRLALARSVQTDDQTLNRLRRDDSARVRETATRTAQSPERAEARNHDQDAANRLRKIRTEEWVEEVQNLKKRQRTDREIAADEMVSAQSTDTSKEKLRYLAKFSKFPEVRRAAIETLALLKQAGF